MEWINRATGGMSGDHDRCFSIPFLGAFSTGVFNTNAFEQHYPALTLALRVGRIEHHDRCLLTMVLVYFAHRMGSVIVYVQFSSVGAGMVWGGGLLFILGSSLGGVGPDRGLRGGGRRGWCEEWARRG